MSSNTTLISSLNTISNDLNRYFGIFTFLFGCLGNILNILVLSQRPLRSNPCALLFLASSVSNLVAILSGLTPRILSGWNIDPTNTILWLCKLRVVISFPSRTAALWFIMLATIDRWLLSSAHLRYRQISTIKNIKRGIIIIVLFSTILYIYAPICYQISSNNFPLQCYSPTQLCRISMDVTYAFVTICFPIVVMNAFSFSTILNIRRSKISIRPQQLPTNNQLVIGINVPNRPWKKTDKRLLRMLLFQITLFTLFALPIAIQRLYSTATTNNQKSDLQNAIETLIFNFVLLLSFLANGISFYIYTLSGGKIFRKALFNVIRCIY